MLQTLDLPAGRPIYEDFRWAGARRPDEQDQASIGRLLGRHETFGALY